MITKYTYLKLNLTEEMVAQIMKSVYAKEHIFIEATLDGEYKQFTYAEFKELLGFKSPRLVLSGFPFDQMG